MIGKQRPTLVSAIGPTPGICPMNILSTIEYNRLTNCAAIIGSASLIIVDFTFGESKSAFIYNKYTFFFYVSLKYLTSLSI